LQALFRKHFTPSANPSVCCRRSELLDFRKRPRDKMP
jgi:hypothetical protein